MSTHQSQPPDADQREFDALLARSGRLGAAWREASAEEPPVALDAAIRAAARRAVGAGPRAAERSFAQRWRVPISIAALLVVSATLTLLLSDRGEHVPGADLRQAPSARQPDAPAHDAPRPAEKAEAERAPAERQQPGPPAGNQAFAPEPAAAAHADAQSPTPLATREASQARSRAREQRPMPAASGMPSASPPEAAQMPQGPAAGVAKQSAAQASGALAPASDVPAPASEAAAPAPEPLAAPALPGAAIRSAAPAAAKSMPARAAPAPAAAAPEGRRAARAERAVSTEGDAMEAPKLPPQDWVERILELRRAGREQEARHSLEEFRRSYPDYPLPPELAALARALPAD